MTYKEQLKKIGEYEYEIERTGKMLVPVKIFASEKLLEAMKQDITLEQAQNMAMLPGVVKNIIVLPDAHQGYGACIGGVAAYDLENGVISPGEIGYDINCGIRILATNLNIKEMKAKKKEVLHQIARDVPKGIGKGSVVKLDKKEIKEILETGAKWAVKNGYGSEEDLKRTEDYGCIPGGRAENVSDRAISRGLPQLGSLGSGNHFLEIQEVDEIFDPVIAKKFGIKEKGQITIGIHCLPKDAKILTEHGYTLKVGELEDKWKDINVKCMNIGKHNLENTNIIKFFKLKAHDGMFKIKTKSGKELTATGDHPILTDKGLRLMKEIKEGEKVIILPFEGVEYEEPSDITLISEEDIKKIGGGKKTIRNLKERGLLPLKLNSEKISILTKLLGFLTGDGWLGKANNKWTLKFIGKPEDLEKIKEDISKLGYKACGPYKCYSKSEVTYVDGEKRIIDGSSYQIVVTSSGLSMLFYALGAPFGNKSKNEFNVPSWLFKSPLWIKRLYLAGFFGAELNKPSNPKNEKYRFRNPLLSMNKLEKLKLNGIKFLKDIAKLLEEFGIRVIKILELKGIITKNNEKTIKLRLKISSKKDNLIKLWSKIGFEYCEERLILSAHALYYLNFEKCSLKKESSLSGKPESKLSITSHKFRTSEITPFSEFVNLFELNPPTPVVWDIIELKEEIKEFDDYVYDFTVSQKDHNFIVDGFVTGNCGSRGLGHQVASDYIKLMEDKYGWENLPDRELINAPIKSELGKKYFSAMACAANFAYCNRQMIMEWVRKSVKRFFPKAKLDLIYDVCHNIAKIEEHVVDGKKMMLCLHRKGATRSFGAGRKELPEIYKETGQPVLLPGSMGTSSYILVGTKRAEEVSFGSTAHGAGRVSSRSAALRNLRVEDIKKELEDKGIDIEVGSWKGLVEEAPSVYKDIDEVALISDKVGIGKIVAKLKPMAVMKG